MISKSRGLLSHGAVIRFSGYVVSETSFFGGTLFFPSLGLSIASLCRITYVV